MSLKHQNNLFLPDYSHKKLIRITTAPMAFKYLLNGQMRFMAVNGFNVLMISADGKEVTEIIENEQCPHIVVPMTRKITLISDLKCVIKLIKIFRKEKPDIVHTHTPKAGLLGMISAALTGVPIRLHSNSGTPLIIATGLKRAMYFFTEYLTCKTATLVLPNSQSLLNYLAAANVCKKDKLVLVGKGSTNGIECAYFSKKAVEINEQEHLKKTINWDINNFYFLFAGRILSSKGVGELVQAFITIHKINPSVRLILAGAIEKNLDPLPDEIVNQIEMHPAIHTLGWVTDIRPAMSIANVLVHPSHREGFSNVLLQAGAMELPVICSDCIGNIDIVMDKINAVVFPVKNTNDLQKALVFATNNRNEMKNYAVALYDHVKSNFEKIIVQQKLLEFYNDRLAQYMNNISKAK